MIEVENSKETIGYGKKLEGMKQELKDMSNEKLNFYEEWNKIVELSQNYSRVLGVEFKIDKNEIEGKEEVQATEEVKATLIHEIDMILKNIYKRAARHFVKDILQNSFNFSRFTDSSEIIEDVSVYLLPYGFVYALAKDLKTKMSQIRKLFSEILKLKTVRNKSLQVSRISFMSKYALARGTIRPLLDEFIQNSMEIIKANNYATDEIEGFIEVFKALIAYSKAK